MYTGGEELEGVGEQKEYNKNISAKNFKLDELDFQIYVED